MNVRFSVVWDPSLKNLAAVSSKFLGLFLDEALLESFLNDETLICLFLFRAVQCFWDIMYPYGEEQGDSEMLVTDVQAGSCIPVPINPDLGFYFFGIQHFQLFVSTQTKLCFFVVWYFLLSF